MTETAAAARPPRAPLPPAPLRVSPDRRYLTDATGAPFFFLADTCWFVVWLGTPDQWERYLDLRAQQGYTVMQVQLLPFHWDEPDPDGNLPFRERPDGEDDVARPNETYFERFDTFIRMAAERGMYTALFLIWGGGRFTVHSNHFTTEQAQGFMRYASERFGHYPVLWSVSGDAPYVEELERWEAIGGALEAADARRHPTTNHLIPWMNWHALHHASAWHDFHMLQTGHSPDSYPDISALPEAYYKLTPPKPVVNGEPWYEGHPAYQREGWGRESTPFDIRYAFWVSILSGCTMGHTYGGQGVWNWKRDGDSDRRVGGPGMGPPWHEGMRREGAAQCALGARLLRTLPWWTLTPASERVQLRPAHPDVTYRPFCAMADDTWVAYLPAATGELVLKGLPVGAWQARWFNPRTGVERDIGEAVGDAHRLWRAPSAPSEYDWVLVLTR